jgi:hypothetical protein
MRRKKLLFHTEASARRQSHKSGPFERTGGKFWTETPVHSNVVATVPPTLPRLFLIFCALCLGLGAPARAERKPAQIVGNAPPQPVEMNLKIRREGKTEIPLRIYGKANEPLKYLIRVPPTRGRLSEPRATEREVSTVIYEPPADLAITTDKFSYAVQSSAGVSAAVEVSVTIVDRPPQLGIQDRLDFSTIRAGSSNSRLLEISNQGGLIATGEVIVDPPWKIDGKSGYRLRAGDVAVFKILFEPSVGGDFEGVARYTSSPEHSTTLRGVSESAIAANPAQWVLQQVPGDVTRSGTFELINQLDEPRTLQLKTDARLKIPPTVTLAPRGKATIPIEALADNVQSLDTEIRLEAPDFSIAVPVRVPALTAVLRTTTSAVEFGNLATAHGASAQFEVENVGGAPGAISWDISAPFRLPKKSAMLQPGEKKQFALEIEDNAAGRYRTWLKFKSGEQLFDIPVEAEVAGNPQRPTAGPAPASAPGTASTAPANASVLPDPPEPPPPPPAPLVSLDWNADPMLPKGVHVDQITASSAVIVWPASLSPAKQFRVEMRQLQAGPDGKIQVVWLQPAGIPIEARGATFAAILTGLQPGQPWTIRVMPLQASGEAGNRLFTLTFQTATKGSFAGRLAKPSLLQLLVIALIGLLGWQAWRRWGTRTPA